MGARPAAWNVLQGLHDAPASVCHRSVRRPRRDGVGGALRHRLYEPHAAAPSARGADADHRVDADHIKLTAGCGGAEGGADIVIINQTLQATVSNDVGTVSLASGCGAWEADVLAHTGDSLTISQEADGVSSLATIYMVR